MVRVEPMTTVMLFAFEVVFTILFVSSIVIVFHYWMEKKERKGKAVRGKDKTNRGKVKAIREYRLLNFRGQS